MNEPDKFPIKPPLQQTVVNGGLTHIPLFQYEAAVEAHKNTLDLLRIIQADKKELKEELEAAYREIDRLSGILNYR